MSNPATLVTDTRATLVRYKTTCAIPVGYAALSPLAEAAPGFVEQTNAAASQYRDEALPGALLTLVGPQALQALRTAHSASLTHKEAWHAADKALRTAPSLEDVNPAFHPERRLRFRGLKEAEAVRLVGAADLADLTALVIDGNLAALPASAFELASDRYLEQVVMARTGISRTYRLTPSATNPLADGTDEPAARRAAQLVIEGHKADGDAIKIHENALRDWTVLLAHSFGLTADDVFARAIGQ
jgi:hypothetical protein